MLTTISPFSNILKIFSSHWVRFSQMSLSGSHILNILRLRNIFLWITFPSPSSSFRACRWIVNGDHTFFIKIRIIWRYTLYTHIHILTNGQILERNRHSVCLIMIMNFLIWTSWLTPISMTTTRHILADMCIFVFVVVYTSHINWACGNFLNGWHVRLQVSTCRYDFLWPAVSCNVTHLLLVYNGAWHNYLL